MLRDPLRAAARQHHSNAQPPALRARVRPRAGDFQAMYTAYFNEIKPIGETQITYLEQLVHAIWNLNIARQLLVSALAAMDDRKIANANRYIAQYERSFAKAHKAIKDDQTDLALRAIPENEPIADLPLTCKIQVIAHEATRAATLQERTQRALTARSSSNAPALPSAPPPCPTNTKTKPKWISRPDG